MYFILVITAVFDIMGDDSKLKKRGYGYGF